MLCIVCCEEFNNNNISQHYSEDHSLYFCTDCEIVTSKLISFKLHQVYCRPAPYAVPAINTDIIVANIDTKLDSQYAMCFCGDVVMRKRLPDHRKSSANSECVPRKCVRCFEKICSLNAFRSHICLIANTFESVEISCDSLSTYENEFEKFLDENSKTLIK